MKFFYTIPHPSFRFTFILPEFYLHLTNFVTDILFTNLSRLSRFAFATLQGAVRSSMQNPNIIEHSLWRTFLPIKFRLEALPGGNAQFHMETINLWEVDLHLC